MAKKDSTLEVTKDLQETVKKNKNIQNIYFDEMGNHYFNTHEVEVHDVDDRGFSKSAKKVTALPGVKFGIAKVKNAMGKIIDKRVNVEYTPVAAEFTREEILSAKPVANARTEKEKLEIMSAASEIAKGGDFEDLMKKFKAA